MSVAFPHNGAVRRKDRHGRGGIVEVRGQSGNVGNDRVLLIRIDDVAPAAFEKDLAPDIAAGFLDRGRIGEPDGLAVVADVDPVAAVGREALGGAVEGGAHDVEDVARDAGLEAVAAASDPVPAGAVGEGVESVVEGLVVEGDVHVLGKPADDAVDLRERRAALEGHGLGVGKGEERLQHSADPDVFLQDDGRPTGAGGEGPKYVAPLSGIE